MHNRDHYKRGSTFSVTGLEEYLRLFLYAVSLDPLDIGVLLQDDRIEQTKATTQISYKHKGTNHIKQDAIVSSY